MKIVVSDCFFFLLMDFKHAKGHIKGFLKLNFSYFWYHYEILTIFIKLYVRNSDWRNIWMCMWKRRKHIQPKLFTPNKSYHLWKMGCGNMEIHLSPRNFNYLLEKLHFEICIVCSTLWLGLACGKVESPHIQPQSSWHITIWQFIWKVTCGNVGKTPVPIV